MLTEAWLRRKKFRSSARRQNSLEPGSPLHFYSKYTEYTPSILSAEQRLEEMVEHEVGEE